MPHLNKHDLQLVRVHTAVKKLGIGYSKAIHTRNSVTDQLN
jgi:hypothetical protein